MSRDVVIALIFAATIGQMAGKSVLFMASRTAVRRPRFLSSRVVASLGPLTTRLAGRPLRTHGVVFVSSLVGVPPFYLVTIAVGVLRVNFGFYCAAGSAGRLVRFAVVALAPGAAL